MVTALRKRFSPSELTQSAFLPDRTQESGQPPHACANTLHFKLTAMKVL